MQNSFYKLKNISISVFLISVILVLMRTALLIFGFDFESAFFTSDALAYSLYALLIIVCIIFGVISRGISHACSSKKNVLTDICLSIVTIIFLCFTVIYTAKVLEYFQLQSLERNPLKTVSYILCLPTSVLSAVYYFLRLFSRKEKGAVISLFAVCPVIFLSSLLLERFATVSASASSLSHFPDITSLLILALFMLNEGKNFIPSHEKNAIIPYNFITFTALVFSALPDFITFMIGRNVINFEAMCFLLIKTVFALYVCNNTYLLTQEAKENNQ